MLTEPSVTLATSSAASFDQSSTGDVRPASIPLDGVPVDRLPRVNHPSRWPTMTEWRRRLTHILPGFLPLVLWYVFHHDPLSWDCRLWLGLVVVSIGVSTAFQYHRIARRGERSNPACILGYTVPVFSLLVLVPAHAELGLATLAILSFGDGFATLGGMMCGGPALPWNQRKTWAGFLFFMLLAAPWASIIYWGEAKPVVPFESAFLIGGVATVIAAICESIDTRLDDNIRVGLAASVSITVMHGLVVGF